MTGRRWVGTAFGGIKSRDGVPALVKDFGEKLKLIKEHATDRSAALKLAKAKKGLANEVCGWVDR